MTDFKWRHFQGDVILWAVRWYCRYPISYRDLEEMLAERGISVDHTTISIAGSSATPRRWRSGCAGSGGVALIRAGARMKPTSRCGASGPTCTGQSTSGATRSISTCRRPAAPRQRSGSRQGPARPEALGKACHAQYRQSAELWCSDHRIEARRKAGPGDGPPAGEVSQ